ncbi:MAG TPA: Rpn family recombination-promoting nuclease/putative transposase [Thermoanaerobaculia bacterium]
MPEKHDGSYRLLFSHPRMVEDLLRGFLPEISHLSPLERRSEIYLSDHLDRREQDLVWRLRGSGGESVYLLLEFQSRPDPQMALRISVYTGLLLQDLIRSRELSSSAPPPPIQAVVLYNGKVRWPGTSSSYRRLDAIHDPLPADPGNLVVLLFELERSRSVDELTGLLERLAGLVTDPDLADLRRAFKAFLRESLLPARFPGVWFPAMADLEEMRPMLRETVMEWTREWTREGEVKMLLRLLERKFGSLREDIRQRVNTADAEQLLDWGERVLSARSLNEVFGS